MSSTGYVHDEGGQIFDVRNPAFGAVGNGTTDDTAAIVAAVNAAAAVRGTVFVPPGTYRITGALNPQSGGGPIRITSPGGLTGGGGNPGSAGAATVFLCGDSTAGIQVGGPGTYQGFCVAGNAVATTPLQVGTVSGGSSTTVASYSTFFDVWVTGSAANGWTVYGSQGNSFYDCGSSGSAQDGLYLDGGAGGLDFWRWNESGSRRYGVNGGTSVTGGTGTRGNRTEGIRFFGGLLSSPAAGLSGTSKVYLRGAYDWKFLDMAIAGDNLTSHTVDLDQSAGEVLDFTGCRISATPSGSNPGRACISVGNTPPVGAAAVPFLISDRARFVAGDTSVYFAAAGNYSYSAVGWVVDNTTHGPVAASGLNSIDTLLTGRAGVWASVTPSAPWSGTCAYRFDSIGHVELRGTLTSSSGGGAILTLPAGFRPGGGSGATMQFPVAQSNGVASASIAGTGVVTGSNPGTSTFYLDGIRFPVD